MRRVEVVTGGAGAIGGAIAARLAPDHTVVVLDCTGDVVVDLGDPTTCVEQPGSCWSATADAMSSCTPPR